MTINCPFSQKPLQNESISLELWTSIDQVDEQVLSWMEGDGEIHLQSTYLKSLEKANMRGFQQYVAGFRCGDDYLGFSVFQAVDMESDEPSGYLKIVPAYKLLFPKTQHSGKGVRAKVLVGGDVFGTGVHLFRFAEGVDELLQWELINSAGNEICKREEESVDFWLIKDFQEGDHPHVPAQKKANLTAVSSEPLMILHLDPEWNEFKDYLTAFKTKYRTKAKAAFKRSAEVETRFLTTEEVRDMSTKMISLYEEVWCKASFRPGKINEQVLINWTELMGDSCRVKAYFLDNEMVGFQLGFTDHEVLDAILVGFSMEYNRSHSLLETMLLEFVKWGIESGVTEIRYGRTAGELKSTVGCVAIPAFGMVKHGKSGLNRIVKWVGPHLKPSEFALRTPFKQAYYEKMKLPQG